MVFEGAFVFFDSVVYEDMPFELVLPVEGRPTDVAHERRLSTVYQHVRFQVVLRLEFLTTVRAFKLSCKWAEWCM